MRDLYKRLGIKKDDKVQDVIKAVNNCQNASLKKDSEFILSDLVRKKEYDRLNDTLKMIGSLRPSLGLSHTDLWRGEIAGEYADPSAQNGPILNGLNKRISQIGKLKKSGKGNDGIIKNPVKLWWLLPAIFLLYSFFSYEASLDRSEPSDYSSSSSSSSSSGVSAREEFSQTHSAVALPLTGTVQRFTTEESVAPLEIVASEGRHFYIKLKDLNNGQRDTISVFVRQGEVANIEVPLGTYQLAYAAGNTWYGPQYRFGPDTVYSKADETFRFHVEGNYINGYTVELRLVENGNLPTSSIDEDRF